jgi:predicted transcriptional regulator
MMSKMKERDRAKGGRPRASITFPADLYRALEELARRKKVSLAWVVRDAVEKYVASGE